MTAAHAPVPPSGLAQTIQCPASLKMQERYPEPESEAQREGTAAHWVVERALAGEWAAEDSAAPNGAIVTAEMLEGAQEVLETLAADLAPYGMSVADVAVEVPVSITRVHPQCWGTPDLRCWVPANRTPKGRARLLVWDYKFGHRPVEAFENPQLAAYAAGCIEGAQVTDLECDVVLTIIQPRAYHRQGATRYWALPATGLRAILNVASSAAHQALAENPPARTGPECCDCTARHACATLQASAYCAVELATSAQPLELAPEALGLELRTLTRAQSLLESRISGLQEQAMAQIRAGKRVPWWVAQRSPGRLSWSRPMPEVQALAAALGVPVVKPAAIISPRQAIAAGMPAEVVAAFSARPMGEAKLTPDDGTEARRVFG